jgi:DNA repair photolyase
MADTNEDEYGEFNVEFLSVVRNGPKKPFRVYSKPIKHLVLPDQAKQPQGWYKGKHVSSGVRPRTCYTEATLSAPYGGTCTVGCRYCYINDGVRGYQSSHVSTVDPNYPEKFAAYLGRMCVSGAVYITPFTEPFGDLEPVYHNTERLTKVVAAEGLPFFYTTKRVPPQWAIDALLQNPYSYIHFSLNTSNARHYKAFSPGAADYHAIVNTVRTVSDMGIFVGIQVNPVHPGITTIEDLIALINECHSAGAKHFIFKFVEKILPTKEKFLNTLNAAKASGLADYTEFKAKFTQVIGGVYTIEQALRLEYLDAMLKYTRDIGVTMATCHEYYMDAVGATLPLGPWYTTADQCHGRGVPMFYRPQGKEAFEPLPGCYRKGCLWCEEYGTQACHNEKLLHADALKYQDFRTIKLEGAVDNWKLLNSCLSPEFVKSYRASARWSNPRLLTDADIFGWVQE